MTTAVFYAPQPRSRLYTTAGAYRKGIIGVLLGRNFTGGDTKALERALEAIHPGYTAISVPMARVGIYLTLKHLIRKGQKVILSPYTISDVVNMVLCAGGIPLFADIETGGSCNIDASAVAQLLAINDDVGAVLVTHFYGLVCDISPILAACDKRGIPVIEDAAQAFGASLGGKPAGTMGHAGVFSFGLLKNVTGFIGGAVLTKDPELETKIRADLKALPIFSPIMLLNKIMKGAAFDIATLPLVFSTSVYWAFRIANFHDLKFFTNKLDTDSRPVAYHSFPKNYAYRMSSIQADIIRSQFDRCEQYTEERISKAKLYYDGLKDLRGLELPPMRVDGSHIYLYYSLLCDSRDRVARSMTRQFRDVQVSHHRNCANLSCFSAYHRDCPNAERAARSVIYLPTYPGYRVSEVEKNVQAIRTHFREANRWE